MSTTNGYQIREALKRWRLRREVAEKRFKTALWSFPGETKDPIACIEEIAKADTAIAKLEAAQQVLNASQEVTVGGWTMPLAVAVKLVGTVGRREKLLRDAAVDDSDVKTKYGESQLTRAVGAVVATRTADPEALLKLAEETGKTSGDLRAAISSANGREVEFAQDILGLIG